jgi:hypothetical protein
MLWDWQVHFSDMTRRGAGVGSVFCTDPISVHIELRGRAMAVVQGKSLGQKRPLFADFSTPLEFAGEAAPPLRDVIAAIVRDQVRQFQDRQAQRQFLRALTERELAAGAERGKIESGGSDVPPQAVDPDVAVETALTAFEDGLYLVVVDEQPIQRLDERVAIRSDSQITFVRLTLLAGG